MSDHRRCGDRTDLRLNQGLSDIPKVRLFPFFCLLTISDWPVHRPAPLLVDGWLWQLVHFAQIQPQEKGCFSFVILDQQGRTFLEALQLNFSQLFLIQLHHLAQSLVRERGAMSDVILCASWDWSWGSLLLRKHEAI